MCVFKSSRPSAANLTEQKIDVALRVRRALDCEPNLTMRILATSRRILVASPDMASHIEPRSDIAALEVLPMLSPSEHMGAETWIFMTPDGTTRFVRHEPRMNCSELSVLRKAALAGLGVALMPDHACRRDVIDGRSVRVFGNQHEQEATIHLVFTADQSQPLAVRSFIDHLAEQFRDDVLLCDTAR